MLLCFGQLMLLLANMLLVSTQQCKSGIFHINPDKTNTKLDGYNIRTIENISPRVCFDKCLRRPRCHSYNYNRHVLRCELNYQPSYVSNYDFLSEVGFIYVEVDRYRGDPMYDTCLDDPCKPSEICEKTTDGGEFCVKEQVFHEDDCTSLKNIEPEYESGVFTIYPSKAEEGLQVFCNMTNGGWTVIQRRIDGRVNFRRNWLAYEDGFGDLQNEFWLGNKYLNLITSNGPYKLRVELVDTNNHSYYAEYHTFAVGDAASQYRVTVNNYIGNAGSGMQYDNGELFRTFDSDRYDCAQMYGAWWHDGCSTVRLNSWFSDLYWYNAYYIESQMMIQRTT